MNAPARETARSARPMRGTARRRRCWRRRARGPRAGATAVEFALVAPLFIALAVGTIEMGRMIWVQNTLDTAVQSAGRFASVYTDATENDIIAKARDSVALDMTDATFTVTNSTTEKGLRYVTVSVSHRVSLFVPFTDLIIGSGVTLAASARYPVME